MNPLDLLRIPGRAGWAIVVALIIVVAILATCSYAGLQRRAAQEARGAAGMAAGRTQAAQDASAIRDRSDARNEAITSTTKEAADEIRSAPDDDAAAAAALRGLCRLYPGRDPRCGMQFSDPGRVG